MEAHYEKSENKSFTYLKNQNEQNHNRKKNMKYYRVVKITRPKLHL